MSWLIGLNLRISGLRNGMQTADSIAWRSKKGSAFYGAVLVIADEENI